MTSADSYFNVDEDGSLGILRLKPYQGVALADLSYSHGILNAIKKFEADGKTVLLVSVAADNFAPDRMEKFWDTARHTAPELPARFARVPHLPTPVLRLETAVGQILEALQSARLFKVIAVEGDIDFDLLGLLLAFDVRFCGRGTSFENRIVDRGAVPGFGVIWYLARHLGQSKMIDLILNQRNMSAKQAQQLGLMTHVSEEGRVEADALKHARELAGRPGIVLATLAHATRYLECDFQQYLKQVGGGFTQIPPE